ncbi:hypothetical protein [uncultured Mucilaginibacter sp.]|uniref:hypothetical protein n=1 Tax=uncultured Mucilaginibacter sp. TaxID=797541 RepID=UPI0025F760C4|nr:hypothetical protein [uncultured Mucilaginibacter sp.]
MAEQNESMAPGQQNYPSENEPQGNSHALSGNEIREGANEEDQLDELKENSTDVDEDKKSGAAPTAYQYERKITDSQNKSS